VKNFRGWSFNGLAALSLLFFAATIYFCLTTNLQQARFNSANPQAGTDFVQYAVEAAIVYSPNDIRSDQYGITVFPTKIFIGDYAVEDVPNWDDAPRLARPQWTFWWYRDFIYSMTDSRVDSNSFPVWRLADKKEITHAEGFIWIEAVTGMMVPWWLPIVLFGSIPTARIIALYRSRQRMKLGRCFACGYDLRATPDRCPECGTIPPKKKIISN
jgi:hypothetical protein